MTSADFSVLILMNFASLLLRMLLHKILFKIFPETSLGKVHPLSTEAAGIYINGLWFISISDQPSVRCATSTTQSCLLCHSCSCIPVFAVPLTSDYSSRNTPLRLANRAHLLYAIGELSSPKSAKLYRFSRKLTILCYFGR